MGDILKIFFSKGVTEIVVRSDLHFCLQEEVGCSVWGFMMGVASKQRFFCLTPE